MSTNLNIQQTYSLFSSFYHFIYLFFWDKTEKSLIINRLCENTCYCNITPSWPRVRYFVVGTTGSYCFYQTSVPEWGKTQILTFVTDLINRYSIFYFHESSPPVLAIDALLCIYTYSINNFILIQNVLQTAGLKLLECDSAECFTPQYQ